MDPFLSQKEVVLLDENTGEELSRDNVTKQDVGGLDFMLFLIFVLLLMSNKNTFDSHFQLLDKEMSTISTFINLFSTTAQSLRSIVKSPQGN